MMTATVMCSLVQEYTVCKYTRSSFHNEQVDHIVQNPVLED